MAELEQLANAPAGGADSSQPAVVDSSTSSRMSLSLLQMLFSQPVRVIQQSGNSTVSASHRHQTRAQAQRAAPISDDEEEEDDDPEDNFYYGWYRRPDSAPHKRWYEPVVEPQDTGVELIASGEYGRVAPKLNARHGVRNVAKMLNTRGTRTRRTYKEDYTSVSFCPVLTPCLLPKWILQELVPNTNGVSIIGYDHNIYSAQFSAGGFR